MDILKITRKELLKEIAGISFIVREWAKILKNEVSEQNKTHKEKQTKISEKPKSKSLDDPFYWEDESSKGRGSSAESKWDDDWSRSYSRSGYYKRRYEDEPKFYKQGVYVPQTYIEPLEEIVVLGKKYPEQYKKFSVDKWVFKNSGRIEYDHWHSGYDEEGNYVVYFNVPIQNLSEGAFIHEIKHAYDDWNRMQHGGKPIRDTWEVKNIYTPEFEKLVLGGSVNYPQLGYLIRYFYLGSKLETPAYLENEYDSSAFSNYEDVARKMKDFDIQKFFNKKGEPAKGLEEEFQELKKLDIPAFKKFKNVTDFLNWTKKYFNKRGDDIFRRIAKMKYVHGKSLSPFKPTVSQKGKEIETPKKETEKSTFSDYEEEGETMGNWKYSKERGWYHIGDEDEDEYFYRY